MPEPTNITPPTPDQTVWSQNAPALQTPVELPKSDKPKGWWEQTRDAFQASMPPWVRDNSSRINQIGLMLGTAVIIGSVFKGKKISQDIWNKQTEILKGEGFEGAALEKKIAELIDSKVMKKPGLHKQRMVYLPTAIAGLAVGGFIKDKETPEDREAHKKMSLPEYMGMRFKQGFDPLHHSRQTAGLIGAASGVAAIVSAFSQPGGALVSEAFVGATLIAGFTGLTFIDDPAKAKSALNICWATRLPFVMSGTYETLLTKPAFIHPLAEGMKQGEKYIAGLNKAAQEGVKVPRWGLSGLAGHKLVKGAKAEAAFSKRYVSQYLPDRRWDISYPIGQWFNMAMATFGFLMAGSDDKKAAAGVPENQKTEPVAEVLPQPARMDRPSPASQVSNIQADARLQMPENQLVVPAL